MIRHRCVQRAQGRSLGSQRRFGAAMALPGACGFDTGRSRSPLLPVGASAHSRPFVIGSPVSNAPAPGPPCVLGETSRDTTCGACARVVVPLRSFSMTNQPNITVTVSGMSHKRCGITVYRLSTRPRATAGPHRPHEPRRCPPGRPAERLTSDRVDLPLGRLRRKPLWLSGREHALNP